MAELEKFTDSSIVMLLKHNERKLKNDSNKEINSSRSGLNYSIPCNTTGLSDLDYYKQILGNSYLYGRGSKREEEAVTCCSWVVTLPKEISNYYTLKSNDSITRLNPEKEEAFFQGVHEFISARYGTCFHCSVHYDEGGQPHAHYYIAPRTKIDHDRIHYKTAKTHTAVRTESGRYEFQYRFKTDENGQRILLKNYAKMSDYYDFKISSAEVFNKAELQHFHRDLSDYLRKNQIPGADQVYTGVTGDKNISVRSMKEFTRATGLTLESLKELQINQEKLRDFIREKEFTIADLTEQLKLKDLEISQCKEQIHTLEKSLEVQKEHAIQEPEQTWGKSADWGQKNSSWGTREHIYDKEF